MVEEIMEKMKKVDGNFFVVWVFVKMGVEIMYGVVGIFVILFVFFCVKVGVCFIVFYNE